MQNKMLWLKVYYCDMTQGGGGIDAKYAGFFQGGGGSECKIWQILTTYSYTHYNNT